MHGGVLVTLFAMAALPCLAADSAVLRNGFSIRHERRQVIGTMTRLYVNGGWIQVSWMSRLLKLITSKLVPAEPVLNLKMQTSIDIVEIRCVKIPRASVRQS